MSSGYESEGRIDASKEDLQGPFAFLRDNDFVYTGYRMALTLKETAKSIFQMHNETINIWTHYIGAFIFFCLIFYSLRPYYLPSSQEVIKSAPLYVISGHHTLHMFQTIYELGENNRMCLNLPTNEQGLYERYGELVNLLSSYEGLSEEEIDQLNSADSYFITWYYGQHSIENLREFAKENEIFIKDFISKVEQLEAYKQYKATMIQTNMTIDLNTTEQIQKDSILYSSTPSSTTNTEILPPPTNSFFVELLETINEFKDFSIFYSKFIKSKVSRWPLIVFLCSAIWCLSSSAIYHSFFVLNETVSDILQTMDYIGISTLISGSYVPVIYYAFYYEPFYVKLYLTIVFIINAINVIVMVTPRFRTPKFRYVRAISFVLVANFAWFPVGHLYFTNQMNNPLFSVAFKYILLMGFTYVLGAYFYARRVPERYFPGKFDLAFYSHNLFHICIVIAAIFHFVGSWKMYKLRLFEGMSFN